MVRLVEEHLAGRVVTLHMMLETYCHTSSLEVLDLAALRFQCLLHKLDAKSNSAAKSLQMFPKWMWKSWYKKTIKKKITIYFTVQAHELLWIHAWIPSWFMHYFISDYLMNHQELAWIHSLSLITSCINSFFYFIPFSILFFKLYCSFLKVTFP